MLTSIYFNVNLSDQFWEPQDCNCNNDDCCCYQNFKEWETQIFTQCWEQLKKVYARIIQDACELYFIDKITLEVQDLNDIRRFIKVKCTGQPKLDKIGYTLQEWQDLMDYVINDDVQYERSGNADLYSDDDHGKIIVGLNVFFK